MDKDFYDQIAATIRAMPRERQAEIEKLSKDPNTKMTVFLHLQGLPLSTVSKMSVEQKQIVGGILAEVLGEQEKWAYSTRVEPLVLS